MIDGYSVAVRPSLNRGMVGVIQRARDLANTAELPDDVIMGNHGSKVHARCTAVNMAYVRQCALRAVMAREPKYSSPIGLLAERADLRGDKLAKACGWKARNGPQPYLEGKPLSLDIAAKFAKGLVGKGEPPIAPAEILELVEDKAPLEYFWSVEEPRSWAPHADTVQLIVEVALLPFPQSRVTIDDLPIFAHAVTEAVRYVAADPPRADKPGFQDAVEAIVETAVRNHRPQPSQVA